MDDLKVILELHNKWLSSDGLEGERANLIGKDLRMMGLDGVDLSYAILRDVNLERASLNNVKFDNADIRFCNFGYANLVSASLRKVKLDNCKLIGADLTDAVLNNSEINNSSFNDATCVNTSFIEIKSIKSEFERSSLINSTFEASYLESLMFFESNMANASLKMAEVFGCNFVDANITDTIFTGVAIEESIYDISQTIFAKLEDDGKLSTQQFDRAHKLIGKGRSIGDVSEMLGVPRSLVKDNIDDLESPVEAELVFQRQKVSHKRKTAQLYKRMGYGLVGVSALSFFILFFIAMAGLYSDLFLDSALKFSNTTYIIWMFVSVVTLVFSLFCLVISYKVQDGISIISEEKNK